MNEHRFQIPEALYKKLQVEAIMTDQSPSQVLVRAIELYFECTHGPDLAARPDKKKK